MQLVEYTGLIPDYVFRVGRVNYPCLNFRGRQVAVIEDKGHADHVLRTYEDYARHFFPSRDDEALIEQELEKGKEAARLEEERRLYANARTEALQLVGQAQKASEVARKALIEAERAEKKAEDLKARAEDAIERFEALEDPDGPVDEEKGEPEESPEGEGKEPEGDPGEKGDGPVDEEKGKTPEKAGAKTKKNPPSRRGKKK